MCTNIDTNMYIDYYNFLINHNQLPKYYKSYLEHVLKHKEMVYIAWIYIADTLHSLGFINENDINNINNLIITHDDSKLLKDEFIPYAKRFNGPKQKDLITKDNFKIAVKLHKERNLHHYESLKEYKGNKWKQYIVELICDYIAMGWEFDNYICDYFNKVKEELKNTLPSEYYNYMESIIIIIPDKLPLAIEHLTENNIEYIYYNFNYYRDPFEREKII